MSIRLPLGDFSGEASVRKFLAHTATAALGPEHFARCQLCEISLRSCGANPVQVCILLFVIPPTNPRGPVSRRVLRAFCCCTFRRDCRLVSRQSTVLQCMSFGGIEPGAISAPTSSSLKVIFAEANLIGRMTDLGRLPLPARVALLRGADRRRFYEFALW